MRTGEPKKLLPIRDVSVSYSYDPANIKLNMLEGLQDITIYPLPLYIMSPNIRVYVAKDIRKCKGCLSSFMPNGAVEGEEPTVTITITPMWCEPVAKE